jgi:hypothetical protein
MSISTIEHSKGDGNGNVHINTTGNGNSEERSQSNGDDGITSPVKRLSPGLENGTTSTHPSYPYPYPYPYPYHTHGDLEQADGTGYIPYPGTAGGLPHTSTLPQLMKTNTTVSRLIEWNEPASVVQYFIKVGVTKVNSPYWYRLWSGMMAGMFISVACILATAVEGGIDTTVRAANPGLSHILGGLVFPVGLVLIVFTGTDLATGMLVCIAIVAHARPITSLACSSPWTSLAVYLCL